MEPDELIMASNPKKLIEQEKLRQQRNPTDTEMLDWLQKNTKGLWINGLDAEVTIRETIAEAMKSRL